MSRTFEWIFAVAVGTGAALVACGSSERKSLANGDRADATAFADGSPEAGINVCAAEAVTAQRAIVDIIVVIDGSGSMLEETDQVQKNLNSFAESIGKSGLDYQVLMIADKRFTLPFPIGGFTEAGICVPPPLGGPNCADNPPKFRMVAQAPDSTGSLSLILSSYESWKQHLRPSAFKVFIEITDDNSALGWQAFDQALLGKAPAGMFGDAAKRKYVFDSICGWQEGTPELSGPKCGTADSTGVEYQHLSILTGGIIDSVCKTSYDSVFGNLAKGITATLGCTFALPQPASGTVNPEEVIVNYTAGGASNATPLVQVTDPSKCAAIAEAWYYDDNAKPTQIKFCPALCNTAGVDTSGKIEIALGCKGEPPR